MPQKDATEDKETTKTHSNLLSETVDTLQNSQLLGEKTKQDATSKPKLAKLGPE